MSATYPALLVGLLMFASLTLIVGGTSVLLQGLGEGARAVGFGSIGSGAICIVLLFLVVT